MRAGEEFDIRLRKAIDHMEGSMELGMDRAFMVRELVRLNDDDDLIDRLRDEYMKEQGGWHE